MVDFSRVYKVNESLPDKLQSLNFQDYNSETGTNQPTIINMQKSTYATIINEFKHRIQRLKVINDSLEKFCISMKNNIRDQSIEAESKSVALNNKIANETKKIDELKTKCSEIAKEIEDRKEKHRKKFMSQEDLYMGTKIKLYSEIRTISTKINVIEIFKTTNEYLKLKFMEQNELISQKENDMQQTLKNIEHKSKAYRKNLKKEYFKRVLNVSEQFQCDLKNIVPLTTQRLMQENVIVGNELQRFWNNYAYMEEQKIGHKFRIEKYKTAIKEVKMDTKKKVITSKLQILLLKKLQKVHYTITRALWNSPIQFEIFQEYPKLMEKVKYSKFSNIEWRKRKLEILLHQEKIKLILINTLKSQVNNTLKNHCNTLSTLKRIVNSASKINDMVMNREFVNMDFDRLTNYLLQTIEQLELQEYISDINSVKTVSNATIVYKVGDLGFDPEYVEIETDRKVEKLGSLSDTSTSVILKELKILQVQETDEYHKSSTSISSNVSATSKADKIKEKKEFIDHRLKKDKTILSLESIQSLFESEMEDYIEDFINFE